VERDVQRISDLMDYKKLFEEFYTPLCRYAIIFVDDPSIAEEIVQEFFISLWEKYEDLKIHTSLKAYLYSSVRNRCFNYKRYAKSQLRLDNCFVELEDEVLDDMGAGDQMDFMELQSLVETAINELPPKCREIFKLSRHNQLSYAEIADELSVSPKTVENQIGIALKRLREKIHPMLSVLFWYL